MAHLCIYCAIPGVGEEETLVRRPSVDLCGIPALLREFERVLGDRQAAWDFMTDHHTDGAIIYGVVRSHIKKWRGPGRF